MLRITAAAAAALALLGAAGPVFASDARIDVSDLDLSRPAHVAILEARVETAARTLCRDARRPGSRLSDRAFCEAQVRAEVERQLPATARAGNVEARARRVSI